MPSSVEGRLTPSVIEQSVIKNKWKCNVCSKIFDSLYISKYHNLLEHTTNSREKCLEQS